MKKNIQTIFKLGIITYVFILLLTLSIPACEAFTTSSTYTQDEYYTEYIDLINANEKGFQQLTVGESTIYIHDHAKMLSHEKEEEIIAHIKEQVNPETDMNVLVLTYLDSFQYSTRTFTDDYTDVYFPYDNNVLCIALDMDNREVYINTMGLAYSRLSDSQIQNCIDAGYDYLKQGNYEEAMDRIAVAAAKKVYKRLYVNDVFTVMSEMITELWPVWVILSFIIAICTRSSALQSRRNLDKPVNYFKDDGYFKVIDKQERRWDVDEQVAHGYYRQRSSSGGHSSHRSRSGRSHGGGGRRF